MNPEREDKWIRAIKAVIGNSFESVFRHALREKECGVLILNVNPFKLKNRVVAMSLQRVCVVLRSCWSLLCPTVLRKITRHIF